MSSYRRAPASAGAVGREANLLPRPHAVAAFDDHALAGLEPLGDDVQRVHAGVDLHRAQVHRVVGPDDGDLSHALDILHGSLWHQKGVLLHLDDGSHLGVLAGTQHTAGIREHAARQHGAGRHVDLPVECDRSSSRRVRTAVGQNQFQLDVPRRARVGPLADHGERELLADRKLRVDRIDLGDRRQRVLIVRADVVTDVGHAETRHAGDRREHSRVAEVELRVGDRGPRGGDVGLLRLDVGVRLLESGPRVRHVGLRVLYRGAGGRDRRDVREVVLDRVVELLLAHRSALGQWRIAGDVELGPPLVGRRLRDLGFALGDLRERLLDLRLTRADLRPGLAQLRLRLKELGLRLVERYLIRPGIDLEQEVASLHRGPLGVVLAYEVAADPGTDLRADVADQRTDPLRGDRDISLDHELGLDDRRGRRSDGTGPVAAADDHRTERHCHEQRASINHHERVLRSAPVHGMRQSERAADRAVFRANRLRDSSQLHVQVWIHTFTCEITPTRRRERGRHLVQSLPLGRRRSQRDVERTLGRLLTGAGFRRASFGTLLAPVSRSEVGWLRRRSARCFDCQGDDSRAWRRSSTIGSVGFIRERERFPCLLTLREQCNNDEHPQSEGVHHATQGFGGRAGGTAAPRPCVREARAVAERDRREARVHGQLRHAPARCVSPRRSGRTRGPGRSRASDAPAAGSEIGKTRWGVPYLEPDETA